MASYVTTVSHGNLPNQPRTAYIANVPFNNEFFTYTVTWNPITRKDEGSLTVVSGANATNCPAGRVLYENGKKLFPPETTGEVGPHPGVTTFMVGVFDPVSFLSGYIDPNSGSFSVMGSQKSVQNQQFDDNNNLVYGVNPNTGDPDLAPTVYTAGNGLFGGYVDISGNLFVNSNATVYQNLAVTSNITTFTSLGYDGTVFQSFSQGTNKATTVVGNSPTGVVVMNSANLNAGATVSFTFSNSFITTNDLLVLNQTDGTSQFYSRNAACDNGFATITIINISGGNRSDGVALRYALIRA
jgi:hypothetical protein